MSKHKNSALFELNSKNIKDYDRGKKKKTRSIYKNFNPIIYERTAEGEEMYDVFSRLMKERIIFVGEEIEPEMANIIIAQLLWLDNQKADKEISLYINSPGGSISALFAIYDAMQYVKAPISTIAIGEAASAAAVLLSAGTKGNRLALPNTEIMIHQVLVSQLSGQATDIEISAKQLLKSKQQLVEILARHCGQPYEKVLRDCERDYYMTPKQAIKYGLIDGITTTHKEIPALIHEKKAGNKTE